MFDAGESFDKISDIEWPSPWQLSQRELVRVIWAPPKEEWLEYKDFMLRHPCKCCFRLTLVLFIMIVFFLRFL